MMHIDPAKRVTMQEVLTMFTEIVEKQSSWKLRSRAIRIRCDRGLWDIMERAEAQNARWKRRIMYMRQRLPPIPKAPATVRPPAPVVPSSPRQAVSKDSLLEE